MSSIEAVAVVFGLLCVGLSVRENIWNFPAGLVQVTLYIYIFYEAKLYSDVILQMFFVVMQFYGWYHWLYGGRDHGRLNVTGMSPLNYAVWTLVIVLGTVTWGFGMASYTDAALPYWDAFTTVASFVAQWLMSRKRLGSWIFWMAVDIVAIGVYYYKSLYATSGLYGVFLVMCVMGYASWKKSLLAKPEELPNDENRFDAREIRSAAQGAPTSD